MGITCKEATKLILKKEEGKITIRQRFQLWRHIVVCSLCKLFGKQSRLISASAKKGYTYENRLNDADKDAIIKAMTDERKSNE